MLISSEPVYSYIFTLSQQCVRRETRTDNKYNASVITSIEDDNNTLQQEHSKVPMNGRHKQISGQTSTILQIASGGLSTKFQT